TAHKSLQDRLVKELRLAGVRTLAEGNALLPAFTADYDTRFTRLPANKKDLHRPLRAGDDLDDAFAWKEQRTLSQALTLPYDKVIFILEPTDQAKAAIGKRVTVVDHPDGRLVVRHKVRACLPHLRHGPTGRPRPDRQQQAAGADIGDDPRSTAAPRARAS